MLGQELEAIFCCIVILALCIYIISGYGNIPHRFRVSQEILEIFSLLDITPVINFEYSQYETAL